MMNFRSQNPSDVIWATASDDEALRLDQELTTMVDGGILQLNPSGQFVAVNNTLIDTTGHSRESVLGESVSVLFGESDANHIECEIPFPKGSTEQHATLDVAVQSGDGIDPEEQDRIFQVFQSLNSPDGNDSGIGLALCKRIVERPGGDIWADSESGEETTVSFTLVPAGEKDD